MLCKITFPINQLCFFFSFLVLIAIVADENLNETEYLIIMIVILNGCAINH